MDTILEVESLEMRFGPQSGWSEGFGVNMFRGSTELSVMSFTGENTLNNLVFLPDCDFCSNHKPPTLLQR